MAGYSNDSGNGRNVKKNSIKFNFNLPTGTKPVIIGIILIAVLVIGKTCFYIVAPAEQAVIKRFGQVIAVTGAGPHFKLPFPIETASFAKVTEVHRMAIGYLESGYENRDSLRSADPLMLTGDENIVSIDFIVQYQINDVVDFLFNLQDVENTIRLASEASIREIAGKAAIDDLLTVGKEQVQEETKTLIQNILDDYKAGVQIVAVELQDIEPPANVMSAFQDVASAREDKNKFINEAEAYANQKIPMARAEAATIMLEAESYKARVLANATGEASRFSQVYESYKKTPDITRKRMYLEAMASILQKSEVVVVDDSIKAVNLFSGFDIMKQGIEAKGVEAK